jgi:hypothetical protein
MRFFFDTEFNERQHYLDLISIGIVAEDGREFYAVSSEFDRTTANDWVRENVLPKIPETKDRLRNNEIARQIVEFVGEKPEFWAYYADYDWVLMCWLFGSMVDLPNGWPMFCLDLKQSMHERGIDREQLPAMDEKAAHDALADARWLRDAYDIVYNF